MMSCLLSKGARDNEDAQSFGYRFDNDLTQRRASTSTGVIGTAYDNSSIPGFQTKMVVGFKPMLGLFNQFKYILLKACPLVLELELVSGDFPASEAAPNDFKNTSGQFELNNCYLQCDVVSLDNDLHNKYVAHLLDGKDLLLITLIYVGLIQLLVKQPETLQLCVLCLNSLPHSSPSTKKTSQVQAPKFLKNTIGFIIL